MSAPVDYRMCCQTVTVYRKGTEGISRLEIPGCFLQWMEQQKLDALGKLQERKFLLIQPGQEQRIFPGDRVMEGIGPQITEADWEGFLPVTVDGLGEVNYATVYRWEGIYCHTEAGRK